MKETPLVSVYITNHNYGQYIEEAIQSVLNQSMEDFEVIIIDDGSTDNSKDIIEQYSSHNKIKTIYQQNKGLNITNNIAMRAASGKYIMRLDADDFLDTNALLVLSDALEKDDNLGLVFPDYYMIDSQGEVLNIEKRHDFDKDVTLMDQPAHGACTMIRRDFLMQLNGYDERYECQDGYELWMKFINHFKVKNISTPLFHYRQHGASLTSNEQKILSTRAKIKEDFASQKSLGSLKSLCVIPVRDVKTSKRNLAFEQIGDSSLLDRKIRQAISASKIDKVVISSPSELVRDHVSTNYTSEKLTFIERSTELTQLNTDLTETVQNVLDQLKKVDNYEPDVIMVLSLEFPFIDSEIINDAINTLNIFASDSLISVRSETNMFFQHHGNGMKAILNQEKFTKLEREALYRNTGGLSLVKTAYFNKHKKIIGGKVGHIVIDQKAAHGIHSKFDFEIADFIAKDN